MTKMKDDGRSSEQESIKAPRKKFIVKETSEIFTVEAVPLEKGRISFYFISFQH